MKKLWKIILFIVLLIINIYLVIELFNSADSSELLNRIISYGPTLFFSITYTYHSFDTLYSLFNILWVSFINPTVNWSLEYEYDVENVSRNFFSEIQDELINNFKGTKTLSINDRIMQIEIDDFLKVDFFVTENQTILKGKYKNTITIKTNATVSYRYSINNIFEKYELVLGVLNNMKDRSQNSVYSLKIKFDKYNPFIAVIPKLININNQLNYKMNYQINETDFSVSNNTIEIISHSLKEIEKYSKKYIAISNDKLFD